jgi:hypothetical protein
MNLAIALGCPNGIEDLIEDEWRQWHPFDLSTAAEPPNPEVLWRAPLDE